MNFAQYRQHIKTITHGKHLPGAIYLHQSAVEQALPLALISWVNSTIAALHITAPWNVLKLYKRDCKVTLLHYPEFDSYAYPCLNQSITIDLDAQTSRVANYDSGKNPPILHRKETFVLPDYPHINTFIATTKEGEAIELYKNSKTIGFKQPWQKLIARKGYQLDQTGRLQPLEQISQPEPPALLTTLSTARSTSLPTTLSSKQQVTIQRHLTAIDRNRLSAPLQKLARHNLLNGQYSILDYGCGKGDDVRELEAHGLDVFSWDPVHNPNGERQISDIVNLGFVLNVIEDQQERQQTLLNAWQCATRLLMVSVMVVSDSKIAQFTPYKDGVITQRQTFQKYYAQAEIRAYLERHLNIHAVAMGQGIFALFKDKQLETEFYLTRQYQSHEALKNQWQQYTIRPTKPATTKAVRQSLYDKHTELFNDFWQHCLMFGRIPANDEFEQSDQLRAIIGSHKKAFELLNSSFENNSFENNSSENNISQNTTLESTPFAQAQQQRRNDILVYFALSLFEKRKAKSHMPARLQRDIKALFASYNDCISAAKDLLFSVGAPQTIALACEQACQHFDSNQSVSNQTVFYKGGGQLNQQHGDNHSYIFAKALLNQMPPAIRAYVGCATQLYGDLDAIDLIKVHIRSGKVTLLKYDDFATKALPLLTERIKIRLHDLDIDFFIYGDDYPYQPLYNKSAFLNPADDEYTKQLAFEKRLQKQLAGLPLESLPNWLMLQRIFKYRGVELRGKRFFKVQTGEG
ncbi:MAG: DNA phosphorothioation-associated putative methyltransferase [Phenylobacterium sp.]|jgi:DNA phosphorothioation-associated putative methyltransferase